MIVYLDASALVKRYIAEEGSRDVERLLGVSRFAGTVLISRAEVASAIGKAVRLGAIERAKGANALSAFHRDWESLVRIQLTEMVAERASGYAWEMKLRGYDAVHLAAAVFWQEMMGEPVLLATYDRQLWDAAARAGLESWPK